MRNKNKNQKLSWEQPGEEDDVMETEVGLVSDKNVETEV